jgi:hypothetical protein
MIPGTSQISGIPEKSSQISEISPQKRVWQYQGRTHGDSILWQKIMARTSPQAEGGSFHLVHAFHMLRYPGIEPGTAGECSLELSTLRQRLCSATRTCVKSVFTCSSTGAMFLRKMQANLPFPDQMCFVDVNNKPSHITIRGLGRVDIMAGVHPGPCMLGIVWEDNPLFICTLTCRDLSRRT